MDSERGDGGPFVKLTVSEFEEDTDNAELRKPRASKNACLQDYQQHTQSLLEQHQTRIGKQISQLEESIRSMLAQAKMIPEANSVACSGPTPAVFCSSFRRPPEVYDTGGLVRQISDTSRGSDFSFVRLTSKTSKPSSYGRPVESFQDHKQDDLLSVSHQASKSTNNAEKDDGEDDGPAVTKRQSQFVAQEDQDELARAKARQLSTARTVDLAAETAPEVESGGFRSTLRHIMNTKKVEGFCAFLIVSNAVVIGAEVEHKANTRELQENETFAFIGKVYTVAFALELLARVLAYGKELFCASDLWMWGWLDLLIVSSSVFELIVEAIVSAAATAANGASGDSGGGALTSIRILRILRVTRLIRVTRLVRLLRFLKALRTLVHSIFVTLRALVWAVILLAMIQYVFAILLTQAAVDHILMVEEPTGPEHISLKDLQHYWGTMFSSINTLFMSITSGISWETAAVPLADVAGIWQVVYMLYIAFTVFAVLNVMTGVFCQAAIESTQREHDLVMQNVFQEKKEHMKKLGHLFNKIDENGQGTITLTDLEEHIEDPEVKTYFEALELQVEDVWTFFKLLDEDSGAEVDMEEFLMGCMRLRGNAKSLDLAKLMHSHAFSVKQQADFMVFCEQWFQKLDMARGEELTPTAATRAGTA